MRYITGQLQLPENQDSEARRLQDGTEGNARKPSTNEIFAGGGTRTGTAGNVLLATLVEQVLDGDSGGDAN